MSLIIITCPIFNYIIYFLSLPSDFNSHPLTFHYDTRSTSRPIDYQDPSSLYHPLSCASSLFPSTLHRTKERTLIRHICSYFYITHNYKYPPYTGAFDRHNYAINTNTHIYIHLSPSLPIVHVVQVPLTKLTPHIYLHWSLSH